MPSCLRKQTIEWVHSAPAQGTEHTLITLHPDLGVALEREHQEPPCNHIRILPDHKGFTSRSRFQVYGHSSATHMAFRSEISSVSLLHQTLFSLVFCILMYDLCFCVLVTYVFWILPLTALFALLTALLVLVPFFTCFADPYLYCVH